MLYGTDSFIVYIKTLPKKINWINEDGLGRKIMKKFVGFRSKTYSYFLDNGSEDKKAKGTKNCVIIKKIKFGNYKICLEENKLENKINHLEKIRLTKIVLKNIIKNQ